MNVEHILQLKMYTKKYQDLFNKTIIKRNKSLHNAVNGNRTDWEKYNAQAFMLIGIIEDFRKLERSKYENS